jgi:hypothetical protein
MALFGISRSLAEAEFDHAVSERPVMLARR